MDEVYNIIKDYDFLKDQAEEVKKIKSEYDEYKAKVLLIGGFSVGKSSIINTFLNEHLLEIDIEPTTAKPQEILYSETRKIEDKGQKKLFYLDNPKLKKFQNLCIVDLPGLSSAIKYHDEILNDYIKQSAFFIIVLDAEFGSTRDLLDFLIKIRNHVEYYALIVNKYDKKRNDIQEIIESNLKTLKEKLGKDPIHYGKTSVFDEDVHDFEIALEKFSKEANNLRNIVFSKELTPIVQSSIRDLEINKIQWESNFSIEEIDDMIKKLERDRENIQKYYSEQKEKIEQSMKNEIENVTRLIEMKIRNNAVYLTKLSQDEFEIEIQKIIESELSKLEASMEDEVRELIRTLSAKFQDIEALKAISTKGVELATSLLQSYAVKSLPKGKKSGGFLNTIQPAVQGASLAALVIPGIGWGLRIGLIALSFLPSVLDFFFSKSKEAQLAEKAPEIAMQLKLQLEQKLGKQIREKLSEIEENLNKEIEDIEQTIISYRNEKRKKEYDRNTIIKKISVDTSRLREILEDLKKNA